MIAESFDAPHRPGPVLTLKQVERRYILDTMELFGGRKSAAALALGISLKTLYNKLNRYELEPSAEAQP